MTQKKARRWVNRHKWHISKLYVGMYKAGGAFCREYLACERILAPPNVSMLNLANQLRIDIATRNI